MKKLQVVHITNSDFPPPEWAFRALHEAEIDLVTVDCWSKADLEQHASTADIVWVFGGRRVLSGDNLSVLDRCGAIVRTGSGTDNVDIPAATARGIIVANTPQVAVDSVADQAIGLLLDLARQVTRHDRLIRGGRWDPLAAPLGPRFRDATLGLIGFGRIAQRVVRKLAGFEMHVVTATDRPDAEVLNAHGVTVVSLEELLQRADYVSVHCPLTTETHHLVGEQQLRLMKREAVIINTARGPIVDEAALIKALREGWIAGAGLDVLEKEPPAPTNPLLHMDNVILTPHLGGNSCRFPRDFFEASIEAIRDLAAGRYPQFVVNPWVQPRWGTMLPARDIDGSI